MKLKVVLSALLLACATLSNAQKAAVSTNILGYAALGTMNIDASYAVTRHWNVVAGMRYNPFTFREGNGQFQYRQQSYSLGVRLWPWHIWSGWWFSSRLRYQEYNFGGISSPETQEGDRVGLGIYSGYTYMLTRHFNLEFGLGLWGGLDLYRRYDCPTCGLETDAGRKGFLLPDDIMVSLVYLF